MKNVQLDFDFNQDIIAFFSAFLPVANNKIDTK